MPDRRRDALERALRTLLTPLAKLALRRGLAFGELAELLKQSYVEAAKRQIESEGKKGSISAISVLTGLTRKEASRLASPDVEGDERHDRGRVNRAARVLAAWVREPEFLDGRGAPASLPFESDREPSIHSIVRRHGGDVTPRAVIEELLRVGAVRQLKDGRYRPVERSYVPHSDDESKITILGTDVADLISTIDHNLADDTEEPFFQRKVAYDNLPPAYLPKLRALVRRDAQSLIETLDADMARYDLDLNPEAGAGDDRPPRRAMVGIYYYETDRETGEAPDESEEDD
jgi:hypothetical protein